MPDTTGNPATVIARIADALARGVDPDVNDVEAIRAVWPILADTIRGTTPLSVVNFLAGVSGTNTEPGAGPVVAAPIGLPDAGPLIPRVIARLRTGQTQDPHDVAQVAALYEGAQQIVDAALTFLGPTVRQHSSAWAAATVPATELDRIGNVVASRTTDATPARDVAALVATELGIAVTP